MIYAIYLTATGEITRWLDCPSSELSANLETGESSVSVSSFGDDSTHYISGGELTAKSAMSVSFDVSEIEADGVDSCTASSIPTGCYVDIIGPILSNTTVTDGSLEFTTDTEGTYRFLFTCFPYLDKELEVDAVIT